MQPQLMLAPVECQVISCNGYRANPRRSSTSVACKHVRWLHGLALTGIVFRLRLPTPHMSESFEDSEARPRQREMPFDNPVVEGEVEGDYASGSGSSRREPPSDQSPRTTRNSPSVDALADRLHGAVSAVDLVIDLLRTHGSYARGAASSFEVSPAPEPSPRHTVAEWLRIVRDLYEPELVPEMVGRQVILGVALEDLSVWIDLSRNDFVETLADETYGISADGQQVAWELCLTTSGKEKLRLARANRDNVQLVSDRPALADLLERKPFADALAIRLRRIWLQDVRPIKAEETRERDASFVKRRGAAYLVSLYGPWGSGKSTLLNFLDQALRSGPDTSSSPMTKTIGLAQEPWVVVLFNAWQHQRLGLPWWWLMNEVFRTGSRQVFRRHRFRGLFLVLREYAWRLSVRRLPELLTVILVLGILWLAVSIGLIQRLLAAPLAATGTAAEALSHVIPLAIGLVTTIYGFTKLLELQSARSAKQFIDTARDPLRAISDHFVDMTSQMGAPVAVFIDDLDRCQKDFVIEFLEGVQTLFIDAPVLYVVSADRRWLRACYETVYASIADKVEVTGRPLGYHFLEKIFQLSVPVPEMSPGTRDAYFASLLSRQVPPGPEALNRMANDAQQRVKALRDDRQIEAASRTASGNSVEDRVFRAALARRLAEDEVQIGITHNLLPFSSLIEANPRSMKALVNSYGILKTIAVLGGVDVGLELALWAIVMLRWPLLAEYLAAKPDETSRLLSGELPNPTYYSQADLKLLATQFLDPEVVRVFKGRGTGASLDLDKVRRCASLVPSQAPGS